MYLCMTSCRAALSFYDLEVAANSTLPFSGKSLRAILSLGTEAVNLWGGVCQSAQVWGYYLESDPQGLCTVN